MGLSRSITVSTATGVFGPVSFKGNAYRLATLSFNTPAASTAQTVVGTLQGSLGGSGVWTTLVTLTTANSTGGVYLASTAQTRTFDKVRLNLSANNRTASFGVTVGAAD